MGQCEGRLAKQTKRCSPGHGPGCLQGSKAESDRVGREIVLTSLLNKTVIIITRDKSTQQVNKITFMPESDKISD